MTDFLDTPELATLSRAFRHAPVGATVVDRERRVRWANAAFGHLVGRSVDDVVGADVRDLGASDEDVFARVEAVLRGEAAHASALRRYDRSDGRATWAWLTVTPLADGLVLGLTHDVTEHHLASQRLRALVADAPVAILTVERGGCVEMANPAADRLLGYAPGALAGRPLTAVVPRGLDPQAGDEDGSAAGAARDVRAVRADGTEIVVEASVSRLPDGPDQVVLVDVTGRKHAERDLRVRVARQQALAELGERALGGAGVRELAQLACETAAELLDVEISKALELEPTGRLVVRAGVGLSSEIPAGATLPATGTHAGMALAHDEPVALADVRTAGLGEHSLLLRLGVRSSLVVRVGSREEPLGVLGAHTREAREFTDDEREFLKLLADVLAVAVRRHRAEAASRHQSLHDPLTGLPNRTLLMERIEHWLEGAARTDAQAAAMIVDIDHFKVINDALGHHVGDDLLRAMGPRLRRAVRPGDTVARFGSGGFAVFAVDLVAEADALAMAGRITDALREPFMLVGGHRQPITASIGVAMSGRPAASAGDLVRNADAAMYHAKREGRARTVLFAEELHEQTVRRRDTDLDLRVAIEEGDIDVHYQPIVSIASREPVGFEALARWTHPERGPIPPREFVAIAEDTGLIGALCALVLRKAAWQAVAWGAGGREDLYVSVNLSSHELGDAATVDRVRDVLGETRLAPHRLALEVTETAVMNDPVAASRTLSALRGLGVRIKLDDFGTGFSSLSHAQSLPVDVLKIDRSFVSGMADSRSSRAIVGAVMQLAAGLDAVVVAEGVETAGEHELLRDIGCPCAQGYAYARPMPAADVPGYLADSAQPAL